VEWLKVKTLSSSPSTTKQKKKKKNRVWIENSVDSGWGCGMAQPLRKSMWIPLKKWEQNFHVINNFSSCVALKEMMSVSWRSLSMFTGLSIIYHGKYMESTHVCHQRNGQKKCCSYL
jgi:hypothetical protein